MRHMEFAHWVSDQTRELNRFGLEMTQCHLDQDAGYCLLNFIKRDTDGAESHELVVAVDDVGHCEITVQDLEDDERGDAQGEVELRGVYDFWPRFSAEVERLTRRDPDA